ncbi:alpha/beta hydrolase [Lamprobacter modestohalophilus]|uniref:esterase/lipase family protein n=1 Tax=Lamprobacter modestohalophilus TaxID=1064514 RepID=UPI002ADED284|nr:alpha/beta hydrolase [Lamprobacter modestohalophilus]MEA1051299.1 alpha/beta hydrolase [Lamprobacter modestohalophilus]
MARDHSGHSVRRRALQVAALILAIAAFWTLWAELYPSEERALRTLVHDQLDDWFPELMSPTGNGHGLFLRLPAESPRGMTADAQAISLTTQAALSREKSTPSPGLSPNPDSVGTIPNPHPPSSSALVAKASDPKASDRPRVLLIHGLDEPGIIWDDLAPAVAEAGFEVWELRYPNDQGIDRSAAFLAQHWGALPDDRPAILIGHSMGGLLAREFVTRWRHPVGEPAKIEGAAVGGVLMVGTPNQGSDWARLRIWLELREHFEDAQRRRFSLFAGLRDGLGEAKIDLRPDSAFLQALNARPWPASVPRAIIGARLVEPPKHLIASLDAAAAEVGSETLGEQLHAWFDGLGDGLGDGAVSVESLQLEDVAEPIIVNGAHRTMLRRLFADDPTPPAIAPIIDQLKAWGGPGPLSGA